MLGEAINKQISISRWKSQISIRTWTGKQPTIVWRRATRRAAILPELFDAEKLFSRSNDWRWDDKANSALAAVLMMLIYSEKERSR